MWPEFGTLGSTVVGAIYGFLSPTIATFDAAKEDKPHKVFHCMYVRIFPLPSFMFACLVFVTFGYNLTLFYNEFQDGTWDTIKGSFLVIGDFRDVCFHSYFSAMEELLQKGTPEEGYYDIRFVGVLILNPIVNHPTLI